MTRHETETPERGKKTVMVGVLLLPSEALELAQVAEDEQSSKSQVGRRALTAYLRSRRQKEGEEVDAH